MSQNDDMWETTAMKNALLEANGAIDSKSIANTTPSTEDKAVAAAKARDHGWVEPEAYNYSAYNANPEDLMEAPIIDDKPEPHWYSQGAVYEWDDEYGEVGPENPELEKGLFFSELRNKKGDKLQVYEAIKIFMEAEEGGGGRVSPVTRFEDCGLHPVMLDNVIRLCGYDRPTPVQCYTIPALLTGRDVIACAQTGSGKTAAYLIPVLSRLMGKAKLLAAPRPSAKNYNPATDRVRAEPLVLVIVPTRELASQVFDEARRLCYRTMLRPCVAYGGGPAKLQREELEKGCDVLIGTPGRLIDFLSKPHLLSMHRVKFTVIDEADELLHGDWEEEMSKILGGGDINEDADRLYMMFSATFNKEHRKLARGYMSKDYIRIVVGRAGSTHMNIRQDIKFVERHEKNQALYDLLMGMEPCRTLIFVNSKRSADMLDDYLYNLNLPSTSIHSDRTQREREDSLRAFRIGTAPIMVATGVSARGLDIKNVMHVINYDLPSSAHGNIDEYVHRIGRTARIGHEGLATSFYNSDNDDLAESLVKILIESEQPIPEFLQNYVPEDGKIVWDDHTDDEEETNPDVDNGEDIAATANDEFTSEFNTEENSGGAW